MFQESIRLPSTQDKRRAMIRAARQCLGTPWVHQGRVPGQRLDCVGLVRYAAVSAGVLDREHDFTAYGRNPQPRLMAEILGRYFDSGSVLRPGSVIWLKVDRDPMHLAIYTGEDDNTLIHSISSGAAKVVEHGFRHPWPKRVYRILEWQGLNDD